MKLPWEKPTFVTEVLHFSMLMWKLLYGMFIKNGEKIIFILLAK